MDCGDEGKETTAWRWAHVGIPGWSSESIGKGGVVFRASPDTVAAAGWFLGVPGSHPQAPFAGTSHRGTQARGLAAHGRVCVCPSSWWGQSGAPFKNVSLPRDLTAESVRWGKVGPSGLLTSVPDGKSEPSYNAGEFILKGVEVVGQNFKLLKFC